MTTTTVPTAPPQVQTVQTPTAAAPNPPAATVPAPAQAAPAVPAAPPAVAPPPAAPAAPPAAAATPAAPATPPATTEPEKSPWDADSAPAGTKPADAPPTATSQTPPKPLELKAPEGVKMEPAELAEITKEATDLGMTQPQAEKYLTQRLSARTAQAAATLKLLDGNEQRWLGELKTQWGDKFVENAEHVKRGFADFDPDGSFRAALKAARLTNAPVLINKILRHGQRLAEDKLGVPTAGKTNANQKATPEQRIREEKQKIVQPPSGPKR